MLKKILIALIALPMLAELFIDDIPSYIEKSRFEQKQDRIEQKQDRIKEENSWILADHVYLEDEGIIDIIIVDKKDTPEIHEQAHILIDINGNKYRSLYYEKGYTTLCPGNNCGCRQYTPGYYVYERIN